MGASMTRTDSLNVKIFADGADLDGIRELARNPLIKGFTTNPTLMRKDGISDYAAFAKDMLDVIDGAPVSFEVFADEFDEMEAQALEIASWGDNVYVKIPITNTRGDSSVPLVKRLSAQKVQVNVTAMMTLDQVRHVAEALYAETPAVASVFAGRIADTGIDPVPLMREAVGILESRPKAELLWASPRELLNIFHADEVGCHIITVTHDLLGKLSGVGKDLDRFSLETVKMFYDDAHAAGYTIATDKKAAASG
jgi:transaldolase|tara:strand:+ start:983 stop:1741 length:759 start_codon:yes stop_codon:yes gene_type:complete